MSQQTSPKTMSKTEQTDIGQDRRYRCGFCDQVYNHPLITRAHISISDDSDHVNHNGMMPEVRIDVIDDEGNIIERSSPHPDDINANDLEWNDFPDEFGGREFGEREKRALLIGAYNHDKDQSYSELEDKVNSVLSQRDFEEFSYSTLKRLMQDFYQPQQDVDKSESTKTIESVETSLGELTPKQIAMCVALTAFHTDDVTQKDIAAKIGASGAYPSMFKSNREKLLNRVENKLRGGTSVEKLIGDEVGAEKIKQLQHEGQLDGFDVDLDRALKYAKGEVDQPISSQNNVMSASPDMGIDTSSVSQTQQDSASDTSEDPEPELEQDSEVVVESEPVDATEQKSTQEEETGGEIESEQIASTPSEEAPVSETAEESELREAVEELQSQIQFNMEMTEDEMELGDDSKREKYAFMKQVNRRLDDILE